MDVLTVIPDIFSEYRTTLSSSTSSYSFPILERITPHKSINLTPSPFVHGCVCGHRYKYRNVTYNKHTGTTLKPKVNPVAITLNV